MPGRPAAWRGALPVVAALTLGCVFTPPPPLPGEEVDDPLAGVEPSGRGAGPAISAEDAAKGADEGETGDEGDVAPRFVRGQEPPQGMTLAEIVAFNAAQGDPIDGIFELEDALDGLPGPEAGALWVELVTSRGVIDCVLYEDLAPTTVANFVGLARGLRPWFDREREEWISGEPYYDGTIFHRVIPSFIIQGGDPTGTGTGNPSYVLPDEFHPSLHHDGGALSMANKGPNTGSAQFFVVLEPAVHLDGSNTVFGRCTGDGVAIANEIANVPVGANDKPVTDEVLRTVRIVRRPSEGAAP